VVVDWLRLKVANVRMYELLDRDHVASDDAGVLQQLLCLFVETLSSSDEGVWDSNKDNLDQFDTDNLKLLV
jgi:hypothetical protein